MKSCPRCLNLFEDHEPACSQCGTIVNSALIPGRTPPSIAPPPLPVESSGRRGNTVLLPPTHIAARPVAAVLVTNTWSPESQVFPLREGLNLIGTGEECAVRVSQDPVMARVHSHVTVRGNRFTAGDINAESHVLANYTRFRTGSTEWTFVIVDPALAH